MRVLVSKGYLDRAPKQHIPQLVNARASLSQEPCFSPLPTLPLIKSKGKWQMETYATDEGLILNTYFLKSSYNETTQQQQKNGNNPIERQRTRTSTLQWSFKRPQSVHIWTSASLVFKYIQFKTIGYCFCLPDCRWKRMIIFNVGEDMMKLILSHVAVGARNWYNHFEGRFYNI